MNASWSTEVKRGVLAGEYRIREVGGAFQALNRASDLRARWSSKTGLTAWRSRLASPGPKDAQVSLKTVSVGRADGLRALGNRDFALGACRSDGVKDEQGACLKRLERDLGSLQEWWENRGDGIAHGFVVKRAPGRAGASSWLRVAVRVSGAKVQLEPDAKGAILASNDQRFKYTGLAAWDADNKSLPTRMRAAGSRLLLEVDDRGARYPVVIDPVLTLSAWSTVGPVAMAGADMVVARGFDVNGDTHQDVLVGFPSANAGEGIVALYLGSPTGPSTTANWTSEGTDAANTTAGATAASRFGQSIAAGNINGDAFADVVIGQRDWTNGEAGEGRVYVFFGQAGTTAPLVPALPALANQVLEGRSVGAAFGAAVALANLDAANGVDLVVGSSGFSTGAGRVETYLADAAGMFPADTAPSATVTGAAGSGLGATVATGDVNGDAVPDVHAGAPTSAGGMGANEGAIYSMITGGAGALGVPFIFASGSVGAGLGQVAYAGDVNGDAFGDVVGGAPGFSASAGAVFLLHGSATGLTATNVPAPAGYTLITGHAAAQSLGSAVAGPVNVDNDGFFDVVAGASGWDGALADQGAVFVFRGSATGPVATATNLVDTDSLFVGEAAGDALGATVAAVGDINMDGFGDIAAGASGNGAADEGKAYLFQGGLPTAKMQGQACVNNGECASGFCVDGFCCNTICGGTPAVEADNTTDCLACSMALSGAANGTCDPVPVATACTSANLCLTATTCNATGDCLGGVATVCTAIPDGCHDPGVCDPSTGICSNPVKPNNTPCDDASLCTTGETCQTGVCTPATSVMCPAPAECKMPGTCNAATGVCDYVNIPDGTACNDANMCTTGDVCMAGACVPGTPTTCAAEDACKNAGTCDPSTGTCSQTNKADGTVCEDGNLCTIPDTCMAGVCSSGAARSCDDNNLCTTDSCVPATGCLNLPVLGCVTDAGTTDATDAEPDVTPDLPPDVTPDTTDATVDVPDMATDRPPDTTTTDMVTDRPPDTTTDVPRDTATDRAPDTTTPPADTGVDVPRDTATPRSSVGVKVGGGGCDCEVGSSESNGTIQLSLLIGLALVGVRIRRRRK